MKRSRDSQHFLAAIDGGGTHTRVRVARADGVTVAEITAAESVKIFDVGFDGSARRIAALIAQTARKAHADVKKVTGVCIGLAGNGRASDQRRLRIVLRPALAAKGIAPRTIIVDTDAMIALCGALGEEHGVVQICGTGAITLGRTIDHAIVRVGGWGKLVGDEGSGYWLGVQALNAAARELDHRAQRTALTDAIFTTFVPRAPREPGELRSAIASGRVQVENIAPLVSSCASQGDRVARAILRRASQELCDQLAAMHRAHFNRRRNVPLVLHGGVVEHSSVGALLRAALRRNIPGAYRVTPPAGSPLDGAIAMMTHK